MIKNFEERVGKADIDDIEIELEESYQKWNLSYNSLKSNEQNNYYSKDQAEVDAVVASHIWHTIISDYKIRKTFIDFNNPGTREWLTVLISALTLALAVFQYIAPQTKNTQLDDLKTIRNHLRQIEKTNEKVSLQYEPPDTMDIYEYYRYKLEEGQPDTANLRDHIESLHLRNSKVQKILDEYTARIKCKSFELAKDTFATYAEQAPLRYRSVRRVLNTGENLSRAQNYPITFKESLEEEIKAWE